MVLHFHWKGVSRAEGKANCCLRGCNEEESALTSARMVAGAQWEVIMQPVQPSSITSYGKSPNELFGQPNTSQQGDCLLKKKTGIGSRVS